jgi:TonB family protein
VAVYRKSQLTEHNCRGGPLWLAVLSNTRCRRNGRPRRAAPTVVIFLALILISSQAKANQPPVLSVLDFGSSAVAKQAAETIRARLRSTGEVNVADADLSRAAAKGIGYTGSLNLTVSEARDLGAALATEFYILGDAQTLRRSSFESPVYFESYCSIFLVSARTGRLLLWERPSFENAEATKAEARLSQYLADDALSRHLVDAIKKSHEDERIQRTALTASAEAVIEEAPEDEKAAEVQGIRTPRPYRRLRPEYPPSAGHADAEATVDVVVDVGADGEVGEIQIARWAGFGLDESTIATVRQLHFFPAMKNGTPIPMRVMLRYNFRKPPR